jgi:uncharacterized membrane protein
MGLKEYILLGLVILVPLVIATAVTVWTLEQARLRSKKNRRPSASHQESPRPPAETA